MNTPSAYKLKRYWETYLRVPQDNRKVRLESRTCGEEYLYPETTKLRRPNFIRKLLKLAELDQFLNVLLQVAQMSLANDTQIPRFSDMWSVSNILAGEFLVDIHHICSMSEDEDISHLQSYLVSGRGATLLRVLNTIPVQGLSCARELGDLLISLLPLCCKFPTDKKHPIPDVSLDDMEVCFSHMQPVPFSPSSGKFPTLTEVTPQQTPTRRISTTQKPDWYQLRNPDPARMEQNVHHDKSSSADNSESDTEDAYLTSSRFHRHPVGALGKLNGTLPLGVFPGLLPDSKSDEPDSGWSDDEEFHMQDLTPIELCLLILNLTRSLCHINWSHLSQTNAVSLSLLPNLAQCAHSLHMVEWGPEKSEELPKGWTKGHVSLLERYLIRVTVTVASFVSLQTNGLMILNAGNTLLGLIDIVHSCLKPMIEGTGDHRDADSMMQDADILLATDILHGIWLLMHSIFQGIPLNPSFLSSGLKLLHALVTHGALQLLQVLLKQWENCYQELKENSAAGQEVKCHMLNLVGSIGKLMQALKKAKVDYIHCVRCDRKKHRNCDYSMHLHHHHDILGISSAALVHSETNLMTSDSYGSLEQLSEATPVGQQECAVALLGHSLLHIYQEASTRLLAVRSLCMIEEAGLCCCMVPSRVSKLLLQNLDANTPGMRNYILCILTKTLMDYCGGSAATQSQSNICVVCREMAVVHRRNNRYSMGRRDSPEVDSALSGSEASSHDDTLDNHTKWHCLRQLLPWVRHSDETISVQVTRHMLRLVSQGSPVFKQELFFCIFLPLLQAIKDVIPSSLPNSPDENAKSLNDLTGGNIPFSETVIQYCLAALPLLLHSQTTHEMFLGSGGLKLLSNLIQLKSFRRCILKVFQVLIVMDDRRHSAPSPDATAMMTPWESATMSHEAPEAEESCAASQHQACCIDDLHEVKDPDLTVMDVFMQLIFEQGMHSNGIIFVQSTDTLTDGSTDTVSDPVCKLPDRIEELAIVCDVWSTCADLLPYSRSFQDRFLAWGGTEKARELLVVTLQKICNLDPALVNLDGLVTSGQGKISFMSCWISLAESSLLLCLACCQFRPQEMLMKSLLNQLQQQLSSSAKLKGPILQAVCDMILGCATRHKNMKDIVQNHTFAVMHLRIDDSDEMEVQELSDYCSTARESETCHTEQGYMADSEITPDELSTPKGVNRLWEVRGSVNTATRIMLYPQLCRLVLELLLKPKEIPGHGVLPHVLLRIITLAKQGTHIASELYKQGLVKILLMGLRKIIKSKPSSEGSEVGWKQHVIEMHLIFDLILLISQHAFSSEELALLLSLYQLDNTPLEALLSACTSLAQNFNFQPSHILCFPVCNSNISTEFDLSIPEMSSMENVASADEIQNEYQSLLRSSSVQEAIEFEHSMSQSHSTDMSSMKGLTAQSALSSAPIQIPLSDQVMWPANQKGFSLSLWLRLEGSNEEASMYVRRTRKVGSMKESTSVDHSSAATDREKKLPPRLRAAMRNSAQSRHWSESCLHLATVGSKVLQLELWLDPDTASIICRLVRHPLDSEEVVCESCLPHLLVLDKWQHLAISFNEQFHGSRSNATVLGIVDGCFHKEVSLDYSRKGLSLSDSNSYLFIGHSMPTHEISQQTNGSWQLANLMLFKDAVLTKHTCFHMYSLGPECITISECDSSEQAPEYTHYVTHEAVLHSGLSHDIFTGAHSIYLSKLRENLLLTYSPQSPNHFNVYVAGITAKSPTSSGLKNLLSGNKDVQQASFSPLHQQPIPAHVHLRMDIMSQVNHGLNKAVEEVGGIGVFLMLFAKVVEQSSDEKHQAKALRLLFTLVSHSPQFAKGLRQMNGYAMLAKVLASSRCIMGYEILKVLLDAALTRPILRYDITSQSYQLVSEKAAIIRNSHIISELILAWCAWDKAPPGVWETAFEAIHMLVRPDHPSHRFNVRTLHTVSLVNKLHAITQERIQAASPSLPITVCELMVSITRCMIGSPPDFHIVVTICDFLLWMHPASNAFVNHSPDQFYFVQKWAAKSSTSKRGWLRRSFSSSNTLNSSTPIKSVITSQSQTSIVDSDVDPTATEMMPVTTQLKRSKSMPATPLGKRRLNTASPDSLGKEMTLNDTNEEEEVEPTSDESNNPADEDTVDHAVLPSHDRCITKRQMSYLSNEVQISTKGSTSEFDILTAASSKESPPVFSEAQFMDVIETKMAVAKIGSSGSGSSQNSQNSGLGSKKASFVFGSLESASFSDLSGLSPGSLPLELQLKLFKHHQREKSESNDKSVKIADVAGFFSEMAGGVTVNDINSISCLGPGEKMESSAELKIDTSSGALLSENADENGNEPLIVESDDEDDQPAEPTSVGGEPSTNTPPPSSVTVLNSVQEKNKASLSPGSDEWQLYPSVDSMQSVSVRLRTRQLDIVEESERGHVTICAGLLDVLREIVPVLQETDRRGLMNMVLTPEVLLVMAHHNAAEIRTAVIKLLAVYLHRAQDKHEMFLVMHGCHLLASQLHQHQANRLLMEACFFMLTGMPVSLDDDLDMSILHLNKVERKSVVVVLSLLENSVQDTALCHNTIAHLIKVFDSGAEMASTMLEGGLLETLCNVVMVINASPPRFTDLGTDEKQLLMEDVQHLFRCIAEKAFNTSGLGYYQYLEDSLTLLYSLEVQQIELYGGHSEEVGNVRTIQCYMLQCILDLVLIRLEEPRTASGGGTFMFRKPFIQRVEELLEAPIRALSGASSSESEGKVGKRALIRRFSEGPDPDELPTDPSLGSHNRARRRSEVIRPPGGLLEEPFRQRSATQPAKGSSPHNHAMMTGKQTKASELSQSELLDRFKKIVTAAVDYAIFASPGMNLESRSASRLASLVENHIEIITFEMSFARHLLEFLVRGISLGMERGFFQRKALNHTMWQAKDVLRMQFSRLITHMLAPNEELSQRLFALDILANETKCRDILKLTSQINAAGQKLVYYIWELMTTHLNELSQAHREEADEVMNTLQTCGFQVLRLGSRVSPEHQASLQEDSKMWQMDTSRDCKQWVKKKEAASARLVSKLELLGKKISGSAMEVTQLVGKSQNQQQRAFVEHIKKAMTTSVQVKKSWQQLIQQLTHERGVWHDKKSYPQSWQLDPTEGPCRERRRLQRCHLSIEGRFLAPEYKYKLKADQYDPPLSYLFDEDASSSDSGALIYRLHTNEKIEHTCRCTSVTPSSETQGELLVGQTCVYFVGDKAIMDANFTQVLLGDSDILSMTLPHMDIKEFQKRWWGLKDNALEIFLTNGKTCLLAFGSTQDRDQVLQMLSSLDLPNLIKAGDRDLETIRDLWRDGLITNFEYLTQLNKMSGRSFNDLMQYPVFPFILSQYNAESLDLEDSASYRNLAKPIAVQDKSREAKFLENYHWLEMEHNKVDEDDLMGYRSEPYHYGSHYSNSGTVLHFLVRLAPFTQMFLSYQDQNFDLPDRTFHCMQTSWRLASFESPTDVKEIIPEFFFLPEFLLNGEGFHFGTRQSGDKVWDIQLPPWACDDPRLFILIHRQALESDYITQNLPYWIDLVFGFRQKGRPAIESVNVFHPATYFGVDVDSIADPVRRNALRTMIRTYGQTPKMLFSVPHPAPNVRAQSSKEKSTKNLPNGSIQKPSPISTVYGLRWGNYIFSPDQPEPILAWSQKHGAIVASIVALPTGQMFGLGSCSHLLAKYSQENSLTPAHCTDVYWAAIISWGHPDSIIRITNKRGHPPVNFLHWNTNEQVTCCASVPDCRLIFFGGTSGVISVYHTKFNPAKPSDLQVFGQGLRLYGHDASVTAMHLCKPFSILVSASDDKTCIIWDLNRLCYVASIHEHKHPVTVVCVSETTGDIASVSYTERGSCLMLHTVNAKYVAKKEVRKYAVRCLAMTSAPEGRNVNIIAGGLSNGTIRMWSSWDLTHVRDITMDVFTLPLISLSFTYDNQRLFAANSKGTVIMWEKPTSKSKPPNFIPYI